MDKFPLIRRIDDVLPFIKERTEFVVGEREWGTVIDYQVTLPDSFGTPQATECRGIKFGLDGSLIARPYHKFFNLGEKVATQSKTLAEAGRFHQHFSIMPKLDGSMIHPILSGDCVAFCTRMGITDGGKQALEFAEQSVRTTEPWYLDFCYDLMKSGMTPIFEWCTRQNRIVLDYPEDELILTAIRVNLTGEYLTYRKMWTLAEPYRIPMVSLFEGDWDGIDAFADMVHNIEDAEGFVLRWDDGNMVKMKGEWYLQIHKAKDHISHEKRVIGLILEDNVDDVLPFLLERDFERLTAYREDFWNTIDKMAESLEIRVDISRNFPTDTGMSDAEAIKWFALEVVAKYKGPLIPLKGLMFATWNNKGTARDAIIALLRNKFSLGIIGAKANGNQRMVDDLRSAGLLPKKDWLDY
jgi:RNA ligase